MPATQSGGYKSSNAELQEVYIISKDCTDHAIGLYQLLEREEIGNVRSYVAPPV